MRTECLGSPESRIEGLFGKVSNANESEEKDSPHDSPTSNFRAMDKIVLY